MERDKLVLTCIGPDFLGRFVYKDEKGKFFKDIDEKQHRTPMICTVNGGFDGEPDTLIKYIPKYKDLEIEFKPNRETV